jgi:hypothetical protein
MDAVRVALLREVLAGTEWLGSTRRFAGALRGSVVSYGGGLLLVGTPAYEPWHLAAHLVDEATWSGTPELAPTLVRHDPRASGPGQLSVGLGRIEAARRGETLLVVAPEGVGGALLERVHDARRGGAKVLVLGVGEGEGERELVSMAHDNSLTGAHGITIIQAAEMLDGSGLVSKAEIKRFRELRRLRNEVVHGVRDHREVLNPEVVAEVRRLRDFFVGE